MNRKINPISREIDYYHRHLKDWEGRDGEFILIKEESVVDFFSSYDDALKAGYQKFGLEPFLVKQINTIDRGSFISRSILPCHASL